MPYVHVRVHVHISFLSVFLQLSSLLFSTPCPSASTVHPQWGPVDPSIVVFIPFSMRLSSLLCILFFFFLNLEIDQQDKSSHGLDSTLVIHLGAHKIKGWYFNPDAVIG